MIFFDYFYIRIRIVDSRQAQNHLLVECPQQMDSSHLQYTYY